MENGNEIVYIPLALIYPNPDNPRKDLGDLCELAESIKARGIMQNLTVVQREGGTYTAVIGHRRLAAARLAGLSRVPCVVAHMDLREQISTMLLENVQRTDLTAYEQAQGFGQLSMDFGMSAAAISRETGFSETTVRRRLKMKELDQRVLERVSRERQIRMVDVEAVTEIEDEARRDAVLAKIGTPDFTGALSRALQEQKEKAYRDEWRQLLMVRGLEEIPESSLWATKWKTCVQTAYADKQPTEERADELVSGWPERGLALGFGFYCGMLYIKRDASGEEPPKVEKDDREREMEIREAACRRLSKAFADAYERRKTFFQAVSELVGKRILPRMVELAVRMSESDYSTSELYEEEAEAIRRRLEKKPTAAAVYLLYAQFGDGKNRTLYHTGYPRDKVGEFNPEDYDAGFLRDLYEGLVNLGYEISTEERELLDGTSELYYREGYVIPDEDGEDTEQVTIEEATTEESENDDTVSADKPLTRFEAFRAMGEDELGEELAGIENYRSDMAAAIRAGEDAETVARSVESWFCHKPDACEDTSRYCEDCIKEWLEEPYTKVKKEE